MRLLVVTQAVDTEDPVLGFFVRWLAEFAKRAERIEVICLRKGKYELPPNVFVRSLGKEKKRENRFVYSWRFLNLIWRLRDDYDAVFVHMNQEYILLAGWLWKLLGKRVYLWRNHYAGSLLTDMTAALCEKVFCTSKYSYTARYKKTVLMPVGIDTTLFAPVKNQVSRSILFLGRLARSKRPSLLIEALRALQREGVPFSASFYGAGDEPYVAELKERARAVSSISFYGAVKNNETPSIYSVHELYVNASPSGMYDKTIFEAAACGCLPLTSNKNLAGVLDEKLTFTEGDAHDLKEKLRALLELSDAEKMSLREEARRYTYATHSLTLLTEKLFNILKA